MANPSLGQAPGQGSNAKFTTWKDRFSKKHAILVFTITMFVAVIGLTADLGAISAMIPEPVRCLLKDESMTGGFNILVGAPILDNTKSISVQGRAAEDFAKKVGDDFYRGISANLKEKGTLPMSLEIARQCREVNYGYLLNPATSTESLRQDLLKYDADIGIAVTIAAREYSPEIAVLMVAGGKRWNEASDLSGDYQFESQVLSVTVPSSNEEITQASTFLGRYVALLQAVAAYAMGDYQSAMEFLKAVQATQINPRTSALVKVLQGNALGRIAAGPSREDRLRSSRKAYVDALSILPGYPRARLGLAELDYQAAAQLQCTGLDPETRRRLVSSLEEYREILAGFTDWTEVLDLDARARYGIGRSKLCMNHSGIPQDYDEMRSDFQAIVDRYEEFPDSGWLRALASEANGRLANLACLRGAEARARSYYQRAEALAVDPQRSQIYAATLNQSNACS